jgi:hypothetical protein
VFYSLRLNRVFNPVLARMLSIGLTGHGR